MNHKQRIAAVVAGEIPDRVPVSTWGHDFLREWSADELAAHTIERQRAYDYDFVKLNPRWTMFAEPWGNRYTPPTEQVFPRLEHAVLGSAADLTELAETGPDHPVFVEYEDALVQVLAAIGDDVDVIATLFSPLASLGLLAGGVGQPLIGFAEEAPQAVHAALRHLTATLSAHAARLVARGASGLFYAPLQWTSLDVCPAGFYAEYGEPYDREVLAAAVAPLNLLHVCGNNVGMDRFVDYPVAVLNWDNFGRGNPSLEEVHTKTRAVVAGGVPHRRLHKLQPGDLETAASESLGDLRTRVMLTGGCAVGANIGADVRHAVAALPDRL